MKKYNSIYILTIFIATFCNLNNAFSQSTSAGTAITPNVPNNPGLDYLGWDNTVGVPLNIKTEANHPIHFYTNAGAGTFPPSCVSAHTILF